MTSFAPMAQVLLGRSRWPATPRRAPLTKQEVSKTERMRVYLQAQGSATAAELAMEADLDQTALVGALLKSDIKRGNVRFGAGRYQWNEEFHTEVQAQLDAAAALLRKHGWRVAKPDRRLGG